VCYLWHSNCKVSTSLVWHVSLTASTCSLGAFRFGNLPTSVYVHVQSLVSPASPYNLHDFFSHKSLWMIYTILDCLLRTFELTCLLHSIPPLSILFARRCASAVLTVVVCVCVCLSVCLSQAGTVPKRLNIGSRKQCRTIARYSNQVWWQSDSNWRYEVVHKHTYLYLPTYRRRRKHNLPSLSVGR